MNEDARRDAPVLASDSTHSRRPFILPPLAIAQIVARNIVPLAGVLFLGWNAAGVVLLYFIDTMLAIAVIFAALLSVFAREDPKGARLTPSKLVATVVLMTAFFALPLGVPVLMMLGASGMHWRELLSDQGLRTGAAMQVIAAFWSYVELWRALRTATPEQLRIKRRFSLVFLRWVGVLMMMFTGLGVFAPVVLILAYAVLSIWAEVAPDAFLRAAGDGDADDIDAMGSSARPRQAPPQQAPPRKRRHRRA